MKIYRFAYTILALSTIIVGCSKQQDEMLDNLPQQGSRIAVCANIGEPMATTRAVAVPYENSPAVTPLAATVWFSDNAETPTKFPTQESSTTLPRHSNVTFRSTGMTFPDTDLLPYTEGKATYAVGLYPATNVDEAGGWQTVSPFTSATHTINGEEDLMFAPKITAAANDHFSTNTPLEFSHLLTWLKIKVVASSPEAIASWGKITSITIRSKTDLSVNLAAVDNETPLVNLVSYGTDGTISAYDNVTGEALPDDNKPLELGSVFVAPTADAQYVVSVKTANETTGKNITVSLKQNDGTTPVASNIAATIGKQFVITLTFYPWKIIDAVGNSLIDWENENVILTENP